MRSMPALALICHRDGVEWYVLVFSAIILAFVIGILHCDFFQRLGFPGKRFRSQLADDTFVLVENTYLRVQRFQSLWNFW